MLHDALPLTPPTGRAVRIAREGLAAAEALNASGMHGRAAELTSATLHAAAQAYGEAANQRRAQQNKGVARLPLQPVANENGATLLSPPRVVAPIPFPAPAPSCTTGPEVPAVVIAGTSLVRHAEQGDRPFTLYHLFCPLVAGKEHVAFRRFSDFLALDAKLRRVLRAQRYEMPPLFGAGEWACLTLRPLPELPAKTLPLVQDATHPSIVSYRWARLQSYLDAALERVQECDEAFDVLKEFLELNDGRSMMSPHGW